MEIFDYFLDFINLLQKYDFYIYVFIFTAIFVESAAFTGILIPGELFVVFSGFIVFQGKVEYDICFWTIAAGAVLGDSAGYSIGKIAGRDYFEHHKRLLLLKEQHVIKTLELIQEQGGISILLGRLIAGLRATTPFTAGISGMPYRQFLISNVIGALTWSAFFMIMGYLLGLSWMLIAIWSGHTGLSIFFVAAIVTGLTYLFWTAVKRPRDSVVISRYVVVIPPSLLTKFNRNYPLAAAFLGKRLSVESYLGLNLTARITICIVLVWVFAEIAADIILKDPLVELDYLVLLNAAHFRTPSTTKLMVIFSQIGGEFTQIAGVIFSIIYLSYKRNFDYLIAYLTAMIGGSVMVIGLKAAVHRFRPETATSDTSLIAAVGWSFPSGHSMMSLIFYGMLTYFLVRNMSSRRSRILMAASGTFIIFMIGLSRIYLQVHFLSDVLAGYAGGLFWLIACITALEIYREKRNKIDEKSS